MQESQYLTSTVPKGPATSIAEDKKLPLVRKKFTTIIYNDVGTKNEGFIHIVTELYNCHRKY